MSKGLKSAYEAALEKLDAEGISRPNDNALTDDARQAMAEARRRAEAKLAELEILHGDQMRDQTDPIERSQAEERYRIDRQRIERRLDDELVRLRATD